MDLGDNSSSVVPDGVEGGVCSASSTDTLSFVLSIVRSDRSARWQIWRRVSTEPCPLMHLGLLCCTPLIAMSNDSSQSYYGSHRTYNGD